MLMQLYTAPVEEPLECLYKHLELLGRDVDIVIGLLVVKLR